MATLPLAILDAAPPSDGSVEGFLRALGGPTLLRLEGHDRTRTRAVATLLHGNEPSGIRAVHAWLRAGHVPAVNTLFFIGSPEAALAPPGFAHRMLPGRPDLNRCFLPPFETPEGRMAEGLLATLRTQQVEALVDLHNNTGDNPPYAVLTRVDAARLGLASLFADVCVHSDLRLGTLIEATEGDCPGATIECGRAGDPEADAAAVRSLALFLETDQIAAQPERDIPILESPVRVSMRAGARIAFGEAPVPGADLTVVGDIDRHNFDRLEPGHPVGWLADGAAWPIEARGADGKEVSRELFILRDGRLETRIEGVPVMMTTDPVVAEADCLFYMMQPRDRI